mmetsp:Transcript_27223/g.63597  ORF Transcript_27223/g.63597 Transcript_27223/m.63597 type:complete len:225 (-) Transcript_27223:547-1221(-)
MAVDHVLLSVPRRDHDAAGACVEQPRLAVAPCGLGKARVAEEGGQAAVEQDVGRLEVAVQRERLARVGCVQVHQRVDGLQHRAQLLPPRERLRSGVEVAHPLEANHVARVEREPHLQAAAHHQREDEARRDGVEAVAVEWEQVRMLARLQQRDLPRQIGWLEPHLGALDRQLAPAERRRQRADRVGAEHLAEAAAANLALARKPARRRPQRLEVEHGHTPRDGC